MPKGVGGIEIRPIPADVAEFRGVFRGRRTPIWLSGWRHFAGITLLGIGATAFSAHMVRSPAWWEWAAIPVAFLIANFVEWITHKNPMHHPMRPLAIMYEKHTLEHHRFYTQEAMETESPDDFDAVLFSLPSLAFFLLGMGLPIALLFFWLVSRNAGWIFAALAVDYYVLYEYCHLAYHMPEKSWVGQLPGMARLRRHHTLHHDQELMARWNFNVTFPIFDRVFGTHWERAHSG
jgi:hypothetical protein